MLSTLSMVEEAFIFTRKLFLEAVLGYYRPFGAHIFTAL